MYLSISWQLHGAIQESCDLRYLTCHLREITSYWSNTLSGKIVATHRWLKNFDWKMKFHARWARERQHESRETKSSNNNKSCSDKLNINHYQDKTYRTTCHQTGSLVIFKQIQIEFAIRVRWLNFQRLRCSRHRRSNTISKDGSKSRHALLSVL